MYFDPVLLNIIGAQLDFLSSGISAVAAIKSAEAKQNRDEQLKAALSAYADELNIFANKLALFSDVLLAIVSQLEAQHDSQENNKQNNSRNCNPDISQKNSQPNSSSDIEYENYYNQAQNLANFYNIVSSWAFVIADVLAIKASELAALPSPLSVPQVIE